MGTGDAKATYVVDACPVCAEHWWPAWVRLNAPAAGGAGTRQRRGTVPGVPIASRIPRDHTDEQSRDSENDGDRRRRRRRTDRWRLPRSTTSWPAEDPLLPCEKPGPGRSVSSRPFT